MFGDFSMFQQIEENIQYLWVNFGDCFLPVLKIVWPLHASKSLRGFPLGFPGRQWQQCWIYHKGAQRRKNLEDSLGEGLLRCKLDTFQGGPGLSPPQTKKKNGQDEVVSFTGSKKKQFFLPNINQLANATQELAAILQHLQDLL